MLPTILTVDDEEMIRDLMVTALSREGYRCFQAGSAEEARSVLQNNKIDLAILDIMMPGLSGDDFLKELKVLSPETVVLMVTALSDTETAMKCIHLGAYDYILKPFDIDRVLLTIHNALEKQRLLAENREYQANLEKKVDEQTRQIRMAMEDLNLAYNHTLTALVRALDAREKETGSHSERVMTYTLLLGEAMGVPEKDLSVMARGALLHDIGKVGISDNILLKPAKLDEREWMEMMRHPQLGYEILSGIKFLKGPAEIVFAHHERFDGSGYPKGLSRSGIPLGARIFSLVDTLDAMTSDRPYRKALPFEAVTSEVRRCRGTQFDPEIVDIFLSIPRERWEVVGKRHFIVG
ncbi:response regulator receiver modulated metal dependent phosphohydrolase [Geobacter metallireducens RCH3]|uniref:Response receiver-modulated cyclic diguanylate phosphodiesterase n=1 Tax=Geobacter metallireducens (strain ATCC 53774 / DSM 7210 / GS-15) TaxID=269799 RepID=Q39UC6_GEOMG|nr:HD domain-containing phosphohydrolase [Geobacter metallireducens]ABB32148.1 response receiver-modulated cyclic diguanylate phosphodiesterase [Geobacter metallireducens GS-15]EHP88662.1 response regulator receiver modulated metal dependent phosphohydrolase [Geobacter metallireducens RCH3]